MSKLRHLLGIAELSRTTIERLLDSAAKGDWRTDLKGRVALAFFEPSTRTRLAFQVATELVGARVLEFSAASSSMTKGESLENTLKALAQMRIDVLVMRHAKRNSPHRAAQLLGHPVINAGDGGGEHPTQALADLLTIRNHFGSFDGLTVTIVGDVRHSRVAQSLTEGLIKFGVQVRLVTPPNMYPNKATECYRHKLVKKYRKLENALVGAHVAYPLRVHFERRVQQPALAAMAVMGDLGATLSKLPEIGAYFQKYGVKSTHLGLLEPNGIVMHAGPINEGIELESTLVNSKQMLANEQIANGIAVRAAVLSELLGQHNDDG